MYVIKHDDRKITQKRILIEFLNQNPICHQSYASFLIYTRIEPYLMGNLPII